MPIRYIETFPTDDKILGYICGLIATDGCLIDRKGRKGAVALYLIDKDAKTTKFVMNSISNKPALNIRKAAPEGSRYRQAQAGFSLELPKLYQYCLDMGITPRKSLTLDVNFEGKSDEFKWYFLRGAIDGDGCVLLDIPLGACSISLTSRSEIFLTYLKEYFGGSLQKSYDHRDGKYMHNLSWKGTNAQQLLDKLPLDSFCLERKTKQMFTLKNKPSKTRMAFPLQGKMWAQEETVKRLTPSMRFDMCPDPKVKRSVFLHRVRKGWEEYAAVTIPDVNEIINKLKCIKDRKRVYNGLFN